MGGMMSGGFGKALRTYGELKGMGIGGEGGGQNVLERMTQPQQPALGGGSGSGAGGKSMSLSPNQQSLIEEALEGTGSQRRKAPTQSTDWLSQFFNRGR